MRNLTLTALLLAACSGPTKFENKIPDPDPHGLDAGEQTTGCRTDTDCGAAQVCVNCAGEGKCTPGCREDGQCGPRDICSLGTVCQTCPCPPGWCILNPCRDEDNDGYVPSESDNVTCPGKLHGDCNDRAPDTHPGATELCKNYIDDNCDGKLDERDPSCTCGAGQQRCNNSWECGGVGSAQCNKGCCEPCGDIGPKPTCSWNSSYCAQNYGINPNTGCTYGWTCDTCAGCPSTVDPVCGANGSTYDNECKLNLRFTKLLHRGACLPGEGIYCGLVGGGPSNLDGGCGPSGDMYCRDSCPQGTSCGTSSCSKKGSCLVDSDCPAGLAPPVPADCDAGAPVMVCQNAACVSVCR